MTASKWEFNLNKNRNANLPDPIGFARNFTDEAAVEQRPQVAREMWEKKVKSFALAPAQQILMAFLVLYFTGGGLNIFSIFFIVSFMFQPIKGIININSAFKEFEGHGINLLPYKFIYGAIQSVILGLCLHKFNTLGLLPLSPSDWIDLIPHDIDRKQAFPVKAY